MKVAKIHHPHAQIESKETAPVQDGAIIVALLFLLVGVLGFLPGITTGYGEMQFSGHESGAELLGIFQVSVLHNIVHLVFGLAGMFLSWFAVGARWFLLGGGVVYLVLAVYGFVVPASGAANFVPVNTADNWLHVALGVVMVVLGLVLRQTPTASSRGEPGESMD